MPRRSARTPAARGGGEADSVPEYNPNEQADGSDYDNYDAAEHSVSLRHGVRQAPYQAQAGLTPTPSPHLTPAPSPHLAPTPNPHLAPTPSPHLTPTPNPRLTPTPDPHLTPT